MSLLSEKIHLNSIGMKLVRIEPGSFMMGGVKTPLPIELTQDRPHLRNGDFDEHPVHQVTIKTLTTLQKADIIWLVRKNSFENLLVFS